MSNAAGRLAWYYDVSAHCVQIVTIAGVIVARADADRVNDGCAIVKAIVDGLAPLAPAGI